MGITELILLFLSCLGITLTFVHMAIMDIIGLRQKWQRVDFLKKLFSCSACTGWHTGLWVGVPLTLLWFFGFHILFYCMTLPFASLSFCYLFERLCLLVDFNTVVVEKRVDRLIIDDTLKNENNNSFDDSTLL